MTQARSTSMSTRGAGRGRRVIGSLGALAVVLGALLGGVVPAQAQQDGTPAPVPAPAPLSGVEGREPGKAEAGQAQRPQRSAAESTPTAEQVFALHSDPGAQRVIYLDFVGATIVDDFWQGSGIPATPLPAWDPAGDGPAFSAAELETIQDAWSIVAERFAPWQVDVTTEDPGLDGLVRTDEADTSYGTQVVIAGPESLPETSENGLAAGGLNSVAYGEQHQGRGLAFVMATGYWTPQEVADVASHEIGHTIGLSHHTATVTNPTYNNGEPYQENFSGAVFSSVPEQFGLTDALSPLSEWSPVMGGLGTHFTQWSDDEYPHADTDQDDLAIIGGVLDLREDDAPSAAAAAVALPTSTAYIASQSDVDSWRLGQCTAGATVTVSPHPLSPSLDVEAALVRVGDPTPVQVSDPPTYVDWGAIPGTGEEVPTSPFGMGASLKVPQPGGGYVLQVRGTGNGDWADGGVGAYGSVGQYTVKVMGCNGAAVPGGSAPTVPGAPDALHTVFAPDPDSDQLHVYWSRPWSDGGSDVQAYRLYAERVADAGESVSGLRSLVATIPADASFTTVAPQPLGSYVFRLVAVNAQGESLAASSDRVSYGPAVALSAPMLAGASNKAGQTVSVAPVTTTPADAEVAYQWYRRASDGAAWTAIGGATASSYVLKAADVGQRLSVTVTAQADGYRSAWTRSLASQAVVAASASAAHAFGGPGTGSFRTSPDDGNVGTGPSDVAVDAAGFVYVPQGTGATPAVNGFRYPDRIQKFTAAGDLVATWSQPPAGAYRTSITGVDVGPDGHVYAIDSSNKRVLEYDADGTLVRRWSTVIPYFIYLDIAERIAVDDVGDVYIIDTAESIISKFDHDGDLITTWGDVSGITGVDVAGGVLYVTKDDDPYVGGDDGSVLLLDPETGETLDEWTGFAGPTDVAVGADGDLYVLESEETDDGGGRGRVQKFDPSRKLLEKYPVGEPFSNDMGEGLAVNAAGQIYVAVNYAQERIDMLAAGGPVLKTLSSETPRITGTAKTGSTLTVTIGPWTSGATKTIQWFRDDTPIDGATKTSYKLVADDVGHWMSAQVTGTKSGYATLVRDSDQKLVALGALTAPTVSVSGTGKVGTVLTAKPGTWKPAGATFAYQWFRGSTPIDDATGATYTLASADYQQKVKATVTASLAGYADGVKSSATKTITAGTLTVGSAAITGDAVLDGTLTAVVGAWTPEDTALTYQWYRDGQKITDAADAIEAAYTVTAADNGKLLTVRVMGTLAGYTTATRASGPVEPSDGTLKQLSGATPKITGAAKTGSTLKVSVGTWTSGTTKLVQWWRGDEPIAGATATSYKLVAGDVGQSITVKVTGLRSGYDVLVKPSAAKVAALGTLTAPTVSVSGTGKVGTVLTAKPGTWKPAGATFAYQWYRGSTQIDGATSGTYTLVPADYKQKVKVTVKASLAGYADGMKSSAAKTIAAGTLAVGSAVITGDTVQGSTLSAVVGAWTPADTMLTYQWYRDGKKITDATAAAYAVTAADNGKLLTVRVTGTHAGYTTATRASNPVVPSDGTLKQLSGATPKITGTAKSGSTLKVSVGTWTSGTTKLVQWWRGDEPIAGATGTSYKLVPGDVGQSITVKATGMRSGYEVLVKTSAAKVPVAG